MNIYSVLSKITSDEFFTSEFINIYTKEYGVVLNKEQATIILKSHCSPGALATDTYWHKSPPKPAPIRDFIGSRGINR